MTFKHTHTHTHTKHHTIMNNYIWLNGLHISNAQFLKIVLGTLSCPVEFYSLQNIVVINISGSITGIIFIFIVLPMHMFVFNNFIASPVFIWFVFKISAIDKINSLKTQAIRLGLFMVPFSEFNLEILSDVWMLLVLFLIICLVVCTLFLGFCIWLF